MKFFPSWFVILPELILNWIDLYSELDPASNSTSFKNCYWAKSITYTQNILSKYPLLRYSLLWVTILTELVLISIDLHEKFNFASNDIMFEVNRRVKSTTYTPNFSSREFWRRYSLVRFVMLPEWAINPVELYSKFNFVYN